MSAFGLPVCLLVATEAPLSVSLFLTPSHFHFLTLSLLPLDKQAPSPFLTGALSLPKKPSKAELEQKSRNGRPSLIGVPAGTGRLSIGARRSTSTGSGTRPWGQTGAPELPPTSPTVPAHVTPQLTSFWHSLSVLCTNLK